MYKGISYNGRVHFMNENNEYEIVLLNAHLSYKGRSVVIDYEHRMHDYNKESLEGKVPFEVYPYALDVFVGKAGVDENGYADITEVLEKIDWALSAEESVRKEQEALWMDDEIEGEIK